MERIVREKNVEKFISKGWKKGKQVNVGGYDVTYLMTKPAVKKKPVKRVKKKVKPDLPQAKATPKIIKRRKK